MFGDPTSFAVSRSGLVLWRSCQLAAEVPSWFSTRDGPGCGSWLWFDSMCQTPPGVRRFRRLPTRREAPRGTNARAPASIRHVASWRGLGEPKSASFGRSSCAGRQQTFQFTITHFYKTTDTETHELFKQSQTMGRPACPVALPAPRRSQVPLPSTPCGLRVPVTGRREQGKSSRRDGLCCAGRPEAERVEHQIIEQERRLTRLRCWCAGFRNETTGVVRAAGIMTETEDFGRGG